MDNRFNPPLAINLLGPPEVLWQEKQVPILRRSLRALLYYLACHSSGVARSQLCEVFWPEQETAQARGLLRTALTRLRDALPDSSLLVTDIDLVTLDFTRTEVDVHTYRWLGQNALRASQSYPAGEPLPAAAVVQMTRGLALWRSPGFLAGFSLPNNRGFDHWLGEQGRTLEGSRIPLMKRLVDHFEALGDLEAALTWARSYLQGEEMDEQMHIRLMNWLVELGRRQEALQYCGVVEKIFWDAAAGNPPSALVETCEKLRQGRRKERSAQKGAELDQPVLAWQPPPPTTIPFVNRAEPLRQLRLAFQRSGVLAVAGESGIGKTRLLYEYYQAQPIPPRLVLALAVPELAGVPYLPLANALRRVISLEEWAQLKPDWRRLLSALLPAFPHPPAGAGPAAPGSMELLEALRRLLLHLGRGRRLLLVLEDAQWCDPATLEALAYLVHQGFFSDHRLLAVTYRPEEQPPHLQKWLEALPGLSTLSLGALDQAATTELAQRMLTRPLSPRLAQRLWLKCGGNPWLTAEMVRTIIAQIATRFEVLADSSIVEWPETEPLPIPASFRELARDMLRRVSAGGRLLAECVAALGTPASLEVLEACAGLPSPQLAGGLEELERAGILAYQPDPPPGGSYAFRHANVAPAMLLELSPARRRLLHRQVAHALEQLGGQDPALLARQLDEAGELASAAIAWLNAGRAALKRRDIRGPRYFRHAGELVQSLGSQAPDELVRRVYTTWGEVAYDENDSAAQQEAYTALLALGEQRGSPLLMGSALSGLCNIHFPMRVSDLPMEMIDQAVFYLREAGHPEELAEACNRKGILLWQAGRYQEAGVSFESALEAGKGGGLTRARTNAYYRLGINAWLVGQPGRSAEIASQLLAEANRENSLSGIALGHLGQALAQVDLAQPQLALEHTRLGLEVAGAARHYFAAAYLHFAGGSAALLLGRLDDCWQHAQSLMEQGESRGIPAFQFHGRLLRSYLLMALADGKAAAAELESASEERLSPYEQMTLNSLRTLARVLTGSLEAAIDSREVFDEAHQAGLGRVALTGNLGCALALAATGRLGEAEELARRTTGELAGRSQVSLWIFSRMLQSFIAWRRGDISRALEEGGGAVEECRRRGMLLPELYASFLLRQVALSLPGGDPSMPAEYLERMRDLLNTMRPSSRFSPLRPALDRLERTMLPRED